MDYAIQRLNDDARADDLEEVKLHSKQIYEGLLYLKGIRDGTVSPNADVPLSPHNQAKPVATSDIAEPQMKRLPARNVAAIGRALFTDHLLAIELAGTLLLVATIGAIAIVGKGEKHA